MPSRADGFTLIELLIVMVIIAVLAAIAVPQMFHTREKAVLSTMKHDLRNLATAQEAYFTDNQQYSGSLAALTAGYKTSDNVSVALDSASVTGWGATATHTQTPRACTIAVSNGTLGQPICP